MSEEVIDTMRKLSRTALKEAGISLSKTVAMNTRKRSTRLSKTATAKAAIKKGSPVLQIGYYSKHGAKKNGLKVWMANPYWLEYGTRGHTIIAGQKSSRGKIYSYTDKKILTDGVHDFGLKVQHPGSAGRNTLRETIMSNVDEIRKVQEELLAKLNNEINIAKGYIERKEDETDD